MKENRRKKDIRVKELLAVLNRAVVAIQHAYDTTGDSYYESMLYHLKTELNRYNEDETTEKLNEGVTNG